MAGPIEANAEKTALTPVTGLPPNLAGDLLSHPGKTAAAAPADRTPVTTADGKLAFNDGDLYRNTMNPSDRVLPVAAKAPEGGLLYFNQGVSSDVSNTITKAIMDLPAKVKDQLSAQNTQVYAFKDIREYDKYFGTHVSEQVVDGNRLAAKDAASLNEPNAHPPRIAIFEKNMDGEPISKYEDIAGLTRHELGHIITNPMLPPPDLSGNWDRDLAVNVANEARNVPNSLRTGLLSHYFHGPAEIYAETFAIANGGGSNKAEDAVLQRYFPKTIAYLKNEFAP